MFEAHHQQALARPRAHPAHRPDPPAHPPAYEAHSHAVPLQHQAGQRAPQRLPVSLSSTFAMSQGKLLSSRRLVNSSSPWSKSWLPAGTEYNNGCLKGTEQWLHITARHSRGQGIGHSRAERSIRVGSCPSAETLPAAGAPRLKAAQCARRNPCHAASHPRRQHRLRSN